jgi:acyl-CoA synthetase (AMP-forming)/AMP-acid ligase II
MIISGGENVYPSEIEALIGAHPQIRDIAVIGLPDAKWGERVHAVIVLRDGAALTEAELIEWSKQRLAGYKRPRSYAFVADTELPRNATGKVLHRELKARFARSQP